MRTFGNIEFTYLEDEESIDVRLQPGPPEAMYIPDEDITNLIVFLNDVQAMINARTFLEIKKDLL